LQPLFGADSAEQARFYTMIETMNAERIPLVRSAARRSW
jgi:hypothetical protein